MILNLLLLQVIFSQLISRIPPRDMYGAQADQTLIIVHRKELVEQAARHCRLAYPGKTIDVEMGKSKASGVADITVASIKSLVSNDRINKFDPRRFKLVLVDEAHHIVAPSYREVLGHFGLNEPSNDDDNNNSPLLVGVSATFSRFDGVKLGAAIDHIVYHKDYVDMIDEKWLANAVFTTVQSEADLSHVKKDRFGDFATGSLSRAVNTETTNNITVRAWLANAGMPDDEHNRRKSTLVFCVDLEHVRQLTMTFRQHGIDARYIASTTAKDVRAEQLRAFRNREYPVLLNCGLFTEGTDIPNVDCVLLARPTRSKNLLIQMIGRGLRLFPGKKDCHIIDMVATLEHTGVVSTPTLFGLHPDEVLDKSTVESLQSRYVEERGEDGSHQDASDEEVTSGSNISDDTIPPTETSLTFTKYDSIFDLLNDAKPERYIRSVSPNAWIRIDENRYVLSDRSGWLTVERGQSHHPADSSSNARTVYIYAVKHVVKFRSPESFDDSNAKSSPSPMFSYTRPRTVATAADLETAVHAADTYAKQRLEARSISTRTPWRRDPASPSQIAMLKRGNVFSSSNDNDSNTDHNLTKGQASDMITKLRFGGKRQFTGMKVKLKAAEREETRKRKFQELLTRGDVKVGPVDA